MPFPAFMQEIVASDGLINYIRSGRWKNENI